MDKTCDGCGQAFDANRSDARFCSGRCRTLAYRVRRDGPKPQVRRKPLADDMARAALDLGKSVRLWGRLAEDDRFRLTMRANPWRRDELLRAADELRRIAEMAEPSQASPE